MEMKLLVIDDEPHVGALVKGWLKPLGYEVEFVTNSNAVLHSSKYDLKQFDVVLIDKQMPGTDGLEVGLEIKKQFPDLVTIMTTGYETRETLIQAFRDSRFDDYLSKPFASAQLQDALLRARNLVQERRALSNEYRLNQALRIRSVEIPKELVGQSPSFQNALKLVEKVSPLDVTVLIHGETGTGKEMVAREIYKSSRRHLGPFVPVNCGAIPSELFESELFGHEKGAFTGAFEKKEGLFKLAHGGTLFLDEIGEMPLPMQVKLLRVIQEQEILPVGSQKPIKVNVRLLSATNRDLNVEIQHGRFREDLFYRLNTFSVHLPPLRERQEDIPLLVHHFLEKYSNLNPQVQGILMETVTLLCQWPWKGNIREMENLIQRAVALTEQPYLTPEDFPEIKNNEPPVPPSINTVAPAVFSSPNPQVPPSNPAFNIFDFPQSTNPSSSSPDPSLPRNHEALWDVFQQHQCRLWQFANPLEIQEHLKHILDQAEYLKVAHFGRIRTPNSEQWPVDLTYVNPISCSVEQKRIVFHFLSEPPGKSNQTKTSSPSPIQEKSSNTIIHQLVAKGLPDSYLFNLLYPPMRRNQLISVAPQHVIRALVLRYAQTYAPNKPLKRIFADVMPYFIDKQLADQIPGIPYDGIEAIRACLCSKVHVFSGISSKLKAYPPMITEEIQKVFPDYVPPSV